MDGDDQQCPQNACVQLKMASLLSVAAMGRGQQKVCLAGLSLIPTVRWIFSITQLRVILAYLTIWQRRQHQQSHFCLPQTAAGKVPV